MRDLLRALLPVIEAAARRPLHPDDLDLIIVHNTGPIPPVRPPVSDGFGEPGFNVVIGERGRPIYFCKCRPAGDPAIAHEGAIGAILARDPGLVAHVAAAHFERAGPMDVLAVRRLPGRPYHELLEKQTDAQWLSSVERLIGLVERMGRAVAAAMPALAPPEPTQLGDEGRWALTILEQQHGLSAARAGALAAALARGGTVAPQLQHADLWPPNVLVNGTSWYVLDLELFGRVRVPLYDLFHMVHICSTARHPDSAEQPWIARLVQGDPREAGARDLIRRTAERHRLAPATTFAALVYYIVDATARVRARGAWTADWREYLAQAARLADLVIDGTATPDRLLTNGRG